MMYRKNSFSMSSSAGFSLAEVAIVISIASLMMVTGMALYKTWLSYSLAATNQARMAAIQQALGSYVTQHSRLPCPSSYIAAPTAPTYGREVSYQIPPVTTGCATVTTPANGSDTYGGTTPTTPAPGGVKIRIGAVPVRDLGLPDSYRADVYGYLYTYAVTEPLTNAATYGTSTGAIEVVDKFGKDVTPVAISGPPGTAMYVLVGHGKDHKGAYANGATSVAVACGTSGYDYHNCDHYNEKYFMSAPFSNNTGSPTTWFDDTVLFGTAIANASGKICTTIYSNAANSAYGSIGTSMGHYYDGSDAGWLRGRVTSLLMTSYEYGVYDQFNIWLQPDPTYTGQGPMVGAYCPAGFTAVSGGCNQTYFQQGSNTSTGGTPYGGDIAIDKSGNGQINIPFGFNYFADLTVVPSTTLNYSQITLPPYSHPAIPASGMQGWECNGSSAAGPAYVDFTWPFIHPTGMQPQAYVVCCTGG